ncbi:MAG: GEVED domain-containing protein [Chitinophagaceae bacterium]
MIALLALGFTNAQAQVAYSNDFNANSTGWTGNITRTTATSACGSASMRRNLYSGATTGNMISPSVGNSTGGMMTLSFDYKVANWSANTVGTPNTWGSFDVQYGASATGPWTTVYTIDQTNHVVSGTCSTVVVTFTPPAGALYVKWDAFWVAGDYYLNFDNVSITETLAPCSGTPTPGNTISSTGGACVGEPFTLSLQNATTGSGVTYQWESADDAAFTTNVQSLGTAATQTIASQTSASYYRCHVTCSGNTGTSTEVLVTQNAPSGCYCTPTLQTTTYGCTEGDVIAQISVLDGTTNLYTNNSGTGCPSGTAGYSDYTGLGSVVSMTAGNTYGFEVYAGQWAEHYTAWIDYNDDGFFDASERIGYTTSTVSGSGSVGVLGGHATFPVTLSCSPAAGEHRMRVRCAFGQTTGLNILPCAMTTANYGETEDYIVTILPALSCPAPSVLASSNVTATSVDLTWNAGCLETEWIVEYGAMGYTLVLVQVHKLVQHQLLHYQCYLVAIWIYM